MFHNMHLGQKWEWLENYYTPYEWTYEAKI